MPIHPPGYFERLSHAGGDQTAAPPLFAVVGDSTPPSPALPVDAGTDDALPVDDAGEAGTVDAAADAAGTGAGAGAGGAGSAVGCVRTS